MLHFSLVLLRSSRHYPRARRTLLLSNCLVKMVGSSYSLEAVGNRLDAFPRFLCVGSGWVAVVIRDQGHTLE